MDKAAPQANTERQDRIKRHIARGVAVLLVVGSLGWGYGVARIIYYAGDFMIGFHPLLVFGSPVLLALGCVGLLLCMACRSWFVGVVGAMSCIFMLLMLFHGYRIQEYAWRKSIGDNNRANQAAVAAAPTLPTVADDMGVWEDEKLPVLPGFQWYCEHHHASPNGQYRAFRRVGVVHIRIQKIRHGYRGIAFVPSGDDEYRLREAGALIYEWPAINGWVIWRTI